VERLHTAHVVTRLIGNLVVEPVRVADTAVRAEVLQRAAERNG